MAAAPLPYWFYSPLPASSVHSLAPYSAAIIPKLFPTFLVAMFGCGLYLEPATINKDPPRGQISIG
jgi:hypothetical protein